MYSPKTANTTSKICTLKRDNITLEDHWFHADSSTVTIARQKVGEAATDVITLTKRQFNRIVKFYTTPTKDTTHD